MTQHILYLHVHVYIIICIFSVIRDYFRVHVHVYIQKELQLNHIKEVVYSVLVNT